MPHTKIFIHLDEILDAHNITKYQIIKTADLRPNTLTDLTTKKEDVKSIRFSTIEKILDAINALQKERVYSVSDIIKSEYK